MKNNLRILMLTCLSALLLCLLIKDRHVWSTKSTYVAMAPKVTTEIADSISQNSKKCEETVVGSFLANETAYKANRKASIEAKRKSASKVLTPEMIKSIKPGRAYEFDSTGNFKEFEPEMWDGVSELVPGKKYGFTLDLFDKFVEADIKRNPGSKEFWDSVKEFKKKMKEDAKKQAQQ